MNKVQQAGVAMTTGGCLLIILSPVIIFVIIALCAAFGVGD